MNKKLNLIIFITLIILLLVSCKDASSGLTEDELEVIAIVDGEEITASEFDDYMDRAFYEEWVKDFNENNDENWEDIEQIEERFQIAVDEDLKYIIRDKAAIKDAKEKGIEVSQQEIDEVIEGDLEWYKERVDQDERAKRRYDKNFDKNGKPTNYNLKRTEEKILLDKHWDYYAENLEVSDEEMADELDADKDFYVKMEIDLISSSNKLAMETVHEEIEKGKDITAFLSSDDLKVDSYGEATSLDYYREFLGENVADKLYEMAVGEISSIIEDENEEGKIYHIVRINDRKEDMDQLRAEIKRGLAIDRYDEYMDQLVAELEVDIKRDKIKPLVEEE